MSEIPRQDGAMLQGRAETLAQNLPPLLARALRLADGVVLGEHGRKKPGAGDAFWQYRPAITGDSAGTIDWRRSGRTDQHFVQQKEWQAAQVVMLWADNAASMRYRSDTNLPTKRDRAALVALALSALLIRGGERVGLATLPAGRGRLQMCRLATMIAAEESGDASKKQKNIEYGIPEIGTFPRHSRAIFFSDFLGETPPLQHVLNTAAGKGIKGILVQILDPAEESFPFEGRTLFESMGTGLRYETRKASDLRERYFDRLSARKQTLEKIAKESGWHYYCHRTDMPETEILLWIYNILEAKS